MILNEDDRFAIYCPAIDGYHIGPITLVETAEVLSNLAIWSPCPEAHEIELIEVTN